MSSSALCFLRYDWRLPLAMKGITMYGVWSARQIPRIPITWGCINAFIFRHSFRIFATSLGSSKPKHSHKENKCQLSYNCTKAYTYEKHRNISNQTRNTLCQLVVVIMDVWDVTCLCIMLDEWLQVVTKQLTCVSKCRNLVCYQCASWLLIVFYELPHKTKHEMDSGQKSRYYTAILSSKAMELN